MDMLKCLSKWKDDAIPEFGPIRKPTSLRKAWSAGACVPCLFDRACKTRKRAMVHQALVMAAKGLWCTPWLLIKLWSW